MYIKEYTQEFYDAYVELVFSLWNDCEIKEIHQIIEEHFTSNNKVLLAFDNQEVIGFLNSSVRTDYVEGCTTDKTGYIEGIYVKESYRHQGVGALMVNHLERFYKEIGITELGSDTEYHNTNSMKFHKRLGFKEEIIRTFIKKIN